MAREPSKTRELESTGAQSPSSGTPSQPPSHGHQGRSAISPRRRTVLRTLGAATCGGLLATAGQTVGAQVQEDTGAFSLYQGDACVTIEPLRGDEPVEELYDYHYPMERFEGPPGSDGTSYSSEGTVDLQEEDTSILFLYEGPDGLSLVVVHGRYDDEAPRDVVEQAPKRTVSFALAGLPDDGRWVVADDYYFHTDRERANPAWDVWNVDDEPQTIHWVFRQGRTDGGAFRGLEEDGELEVAIAPAFNESAALADEHDFEDLEAWEALSGDLEDPDRITLDMEELLTLQTGSCPDED